MFSNPRLTGVRKPACLLPVLAETGRHLQMARRTGTFDRSVPSSLDLQADILLPRSSKQTLLQHFAFLHNVFTECVELTRWHAVCPRSPVAGANGHPQFEDMQSGGRPQTVAR